ncbi:MAG TPA: hypothetical protein VGI55_00015 [Solirubrobacteraceae bacterium]|jgi:hypothetical protein
MNTPLIHMAAEQRGVELRRAGDRARLASEVRAARRTSRRPNLITDVGPRARRGRARRVGAFEVELTNGSER